VQAAQELVALAEPQELLAAIACLVALLLQAAALVVEMLTLL